MTSDGENLWRGTSSDDRAGGRRERLLAACREIVAADGRSLARALRVAGKVEPVFVDDIAAMPQAVLDNARDGDVVICMGAGSIGGVPAKVVELGGAA